MRQQIEDTMNNTFDRMIYQPVLQMNVMQKLANRAFSIFVIFFVLLSFAASAFSVIEGKPLFESYWWAVVTATSVGYGDMYPITVAGRLVGMVLMLISLLLIVPLITAKLAAIMIVDSDAFTHAEQEEMKTNLKEILKAVRSLNNRLEALEGRDDIDVQDNKA